MKVHVLTAVLVLCFFGGAANSNDIYVWTDENGVKHFSNQAPPEGAEIFISAADQPTSSTPLMLPDENDRLLNERLDQEMIELRRLLEELKQQLDANRLAGSTTIPSDIPATEDSDRRVFDPPIEPFRGYAPQRRRVTNWSPYPYTLCYNAGRFQRGYFCGKSYYTYYPGVYRHYYHSLRKRIYQKHHTFRQPRFGYHRKDHRIKPHHHRSGHQRFQHRGQRRAGGTALRPRTGGIRPGIRIGQPR